VTVIAKVKLLALCLLIEIAYCTFLNSARLHFDGAFSGMQRDVCAYLMLASVMTVVAMNIVAAVGSFAAIVRKESFRSFALVACPTTLAVTMLLVAVYLVGGSRLNAAVALTAYVLLFAVHRFVPGKVWPPDAVE
jgi:hypothetical protein